MFMSLLILLAMPVVDTSRVRGSQFRPLMRWAFWLFVANFFVLMYIGSQHVEEPFITVGAISTAFYFGWFLVIVPVIGIVENTLMDLAVSEDSSKSPLQFVSAPTGRLAPTQSQQQQQNPVAKTTPKSTNAAPRSGNFMSALSRKSPSFFISRSYATTRTLSAVAALDAARATLTAAMQNFALPKGFDIPNFRELANGFFQAEGHIGCRIRFDQGGLFVPVFSLNQNYNEQSLQFFLTLWHLLGRTCTLTVNLSSSNKPILVLRSESWSVILNTIAKYFSLCYGEKFMNFAKLQRIHKLVIDGSPYSLILAVVLVYSLSQTGTKRQVSITAAITALKLQMPSTLPPIPVFADNFTLPSIPFIIGFILGDGTMFLRLRLASTGNVWVIPMVIFPQISTLNNNHLFAMLGQALMKLGIMFHTRQTGQMTILTIEGVKAVFGSLLPHLVQYGHLFYWKYPNLELFIRVSRLMSAGVHETLLGFTVVLQLIYGYPTDRQQSLNYWTGLVKSFFDALAIKLRSKNHLIGVAHGRGPTKGEEVAWTVKGPSYRAAKRATSFKAKQFAFSTHGGHAKALEDAIAYRDKQIQHWVHSVDSAPLNWPKS